MDHFLDLLTQYPLALTILGLLVAALLLIVIIIYVVAFIQGREISFWPPKIGKRVNESRKIFVSKKSTSKNRINANKSLVDTSIDKRFIPLFTRDEIKIEPSARKDIEALGITLEQIIVFILGELTRHPILFISQFSSIPLLFENFIVLLSWNGYQTNIERVLSREDAYPTNDSWFSCVSLYRQATALPYRNNKTVFHDLEIRHILDLYKKLMRNIENFISISNRESNIVVDNISIFESLLDEAESSFFSGNEDNGIVRLEALLSTIHKFLLSHAHQGTKNASEKRNNQNYSTPKLTGIGEKTILLVEDQMVVREGLLSILSGEGYRIATANDGEEALRAMVENDYDLIITDMVMPGTTGKEVVIGAKLISPKSKIIVLTSYIKMAYKSHLSDEQVVSKDISVSKFKSLVKDILG